MILLILFTSVAAGLWIRSRTAWWFGVVLISLIAGLHPARTMDYMMQGFRPPSRFYGPTQWAPSPTGLLFTVARNAMLLLTPSLLLLGELRKKLQAA